MQSRRFTLILTSALAALSCAAAVASTAHGTHQSPADPAVRCDRIARTNGWAGPQPSRARADRERRPAEQLAGTSSVGSRSPARGSKSSPAATRSSAAPDPVAPATDCSMSRVRRGRAKSLHRWTITASRGAYHGAHGTVDLRDISDHETLITATVTPRAGTVMHVGVISRPAANSSLIARADRALHSRFPAVGCAAAIPIPKLRPSASRRTATAGRSVLHWAGRSPPDAPDPRFALRALPQPRAGRGWWNADAAGPDRPSSQSSTSRTPPRSTTTRPRSSRASTRTSTRSGRSPSPQPCSERPNAFSDQ